jgi:hypothetical protein
VQMVAAVAIEAGFRLEGMPEKDGVLAGTKQPGGCWRKAVHRLPPRVTVVEPVVESVEVCTMCDLGERDARFRAAEVIQRRWRRGRPQLMGPTSIERGWVGARARQLGAADI